MNCEHNFESVTYIMRHPVHMTMRTLTQKCVTCFSTDPLDLFNFDSGCACPKVYKYLNGFKTLVLMVVHTKFGLNWHRTFRGDVENVES